jgi:two-component system, chemotaxis family, CheB/CheR fusion protein
MPPDSGVAIVVVMHLDPSHESHIAEIFRAATEMTVKQVSAPERLERDHVYVIAPDSSLELRGGVLHPDKPDDPHGRRHPVDALFSSLAYDQEQLAVAVVLSGTGNNGSAGIRDIKARGGLCLVQDPATAEYDAMPQNSIATGAADHILPPDEMPAVILEYADNPGTSANEARPADAHAEEAFDRTMELLSRVYRVNFRSSYKKATLRRRTERRMRLKQVADWGAYLDVLERDPKEVAALYGDVLIGVTRFFRDPHVWEQLEKEVLPQFLASRDRDTPLKVWVPGCATGEEAYTLAIVAIEALERAPRSMPLQIFATDIADSALAFARRGRYPASVRDAVSSERLARFFRKEGDTFEIGREVREKITFAEHNLLGDPPFSNLDLVSCRNVLIYIEEHAQRRILELFHFSLNPGGLLLLGSSETVGQHRSSFEPVSQPARLYRSKATTDTARHQPLPWSVEHTARGLNWMPTATQLAPKGPKVNRIIEQIVLSRYTSACVVVSESLEIQAFFGPTHQYLMQPTGEARMDLLAWAKPGLYPRLRGALDAATIGAGPGRVVINDIWLEREGLRHRVECTIEPVTPLLGDARLLLVSFRDLPDVPAVEIVGTGESAEPLVRELEGENKHLRGELQRTVEQLDTTNEEYRASHEELLSLNEELQSNNEELQASKEELQSLNEEMVTVNKQLEDRNVELRTISSDLNNLLVSTNIPIIFLDRALRIRRFTPSATKVMHLVPGDVGRPVRDIKQRFDDGTFAQDAQQVLDELVPISRDVQASAEDRWYTRTILPYRTENDRIDGVCAAFFDVTGLKQAARDQEEARRFAEAFVAESPGALLVLDADLRVVTANEAFCKMFLVSRSDTEGVRVYDLGNRQWDIPGLRALLDTILPEKAEVRDYEVSHEFEHIGRRTVLLQARRMSRGDLPAYIVLSITDVSQRKAREEALETQAGALAQEGQRRNDFLAMLGHELRNPLAALILGLDLLALSGEDAARREGVRQMMARQAGRIRSMLDQLLDVARVTAGKIDMVMAPVDLAEAAKMAVEAVTPLIQSRKHRLAVSLPAAPAIVRGDLARLTQVVENLLSNAATYTGEGGRIDLTLDVERPDWMQLRVRDTGMGIDADLLPRIFEPFTQGPRTLDRSAGGLGLGLPLVKRVVELHGGRVEAFSRGRGQGSELTVTLPRAKTPGARARSAERRRLSQSASRRILVVDDQEDIGASLAEILAQAGHKVVATVDGKAALNKARAFRPDVVLIDLGLPKMDGYEVAKRFRQRQTRDKLLLIAVTGYQRDPERLRDAGFDRHLIKPPDIPTLLSWLGTETAPSE